MAFLKRIFLFLVINALVVVTLSLILNVLNVRPYLTAYGLDYKALMTFCLIWGMGGALISLGLSRLMAKWLMGVKIVDEKTHDPELRSLVSLVHRLAREADLPLPQVGVYDSQEVNAFATGPTKRRSLVAVSRGLLEKMSAEELEGVLAHEITHIANGDMVTMTLLQGIVNAFVMFLARILASLFSGIGRSREQSNNSSSSYLSYTLMVFFFELVFMILGQLVIAAYSRFREFRADAGGARLAGKQKMISALESLLAAQNTKSGLAEKPAIAAFKISTRSRGGFLSLLATHPPLEKRIERLRESRG